MTQKIDVRALAALARLEVSDEELAKLEKEIPAILAFVETIKKAGAGLEEKGSGLHNVMRDDTDPHESGIYTKDLLDAAPAQKDNQVVVKHAISRKNGVCYNPRVTKTLALALKKVAALHKEAQEEIGMEILERVDTITWLRKEIQIGIRALDAGQRVKIDPDAFVKEMRRRHAKKRK